MNELIESGDPRAKVVGRRQAVKTGEEALRAATRFSHTVLAIRKTPLKLPRGVFRFRTHEEADQWWMENLTR